MADIQSATAEIRQGKKMEEETTREKIFCILTFCRELCRNGRTDQFAIWVINSIWAERSVSSILFSRWYHRAQFQSYSPGGADIPNDTLPWAVHKKAELTDLLFGLWTLVVRRKHKLNRIHQVVTMCPHGATWRIRLNRPSVVMMQSYVKLLWPLVLFESVCPATSANCEQNDNKVECYMPCSQFKVYCCSLI